MMSNIEITYPGVQDVLKRGAFNVARSMNPGCCADVDKTWKKSKFHGGATGAGISGITRNHAACQR